VVNPEDKPVSPEPEAAPKTRGRGIDLSSLTAEQLKNHKRAIDLRSHKKRRSAAKAASYSYDAKIEPRKVDALELLEARGIQNDHIRAVVYKMLLIAATRNDVPPNRFLFANGVAHTVKSYETKTAQPLSLDNPDGYPEGELSTRAELYAIFDAFWRGEAEGEEPITFEQWLSDRKKFKNSAFELSKILGKEDFGVKHQEWTDFAPRWNPIGLPPNYTQKQALGWLDAQSDKKRFLLVASRNSMKSTWARILALTLTITFPDARILMVSETNKLSRKAMKEFRGYLELAPNNPTLFQQYFPEFTISADEGQSLIYDNPMAHLNLPQNSVESSSMESANTGSRFDFCIADDPISRDNGTGNEDQRAAAVSKFGSIMKLREPSGYAINIQTPWEVDDLGDVMIKRNEEDSEKPLAVRIDPVFEIRPESRGKALLELKEEDVILNFLPKLNWRFVRDEMRSPEGIKFFRAQYMCEWVPDQEDLFKCQFSHEELWSRVRPASYFSGTATAQTVMSLDRAFSTSRYADFSCIVVGKIQPVDGQNALVVVDSKMERWKESELVRNVVDLIEKHKPSVFVSEQDRGWEVLAQAIKQLCVLRGIPVPFFRWKAISPTERAKAKRIKSLELPLSDGRLWFTTSHWTEAALLQLEKFDGVSRSNSHRKDDFCDALGLLYAEFGPRYHEELQTEDVEKREREADEEARRERQRHFHNAMFGGPAPAPASQPSVEERPSDPRLAVFGRKGPWRM
jgi:hypothetical protein